MFNPRPAIRACISAGTSGTGVIDKPDTVNSRYKHRVGARGDMLMANICLYRVCL